MAIINKVAKRLAGRFKFGYHELQDIEQQARLIALEGLDKYDGVRPLENFLWVHVRNRLCTFKRDNFLRPDGPCKKCSSYNNICLQYDDMSKCDIYRKWHDRNVAKLNVIHPIEFSCVDDYNEQNMSGAVLTEDQVVNNELEIILNRHIPIEHRHNYLRLKYGYRVLLKEKEEVLELVREIIERYYTIKEVNDG